MGALDGLGPVSAATLRSAAIPQVAGPQVLAGLRLRRISSQGLLDKPHDVSQMYWCKDALLRQHPPPMDSRAEGVYAGRKATGFKGFPELRWLARKTDWSCLDP